MGKRLDTDIMSGLDRRLGGKTKATEPSVPEGLKAAPPETEVRRKRHQLAFNVDEDRVEKLRVLAFETRRDKQDLMREAMDLLFKKYGK